MVDICRVVRDLAFLCFLYFLTLSSRPSVSGYWVVQGSGCRRGQKSGTGAVLDILSRPWRRIIFFKTKAEREPRARAGLGCGLRTMDFFPPLHPFSMST